MNKNLFNHFLLILSNHYNNRFLNFVLIQICTIFIYIYSKFKENVWLSVFLLLVFPNPLYADALVITALIPASSTTNNRVIVKKQNG